MRGQADGFLEASKEPAARGVEVTRTTLEGAVDRDAESATIGPAGVD